MEKFFPEFENANARRNYPFAEHCTMVDREGVGLGAGIFVDAALYPINSSGRLYLASASPGGVIEIRDEAGVVMSAVFVPGEDALEFYDTSPLRRHVGTMVAASSDALSTFCNTTSERYFSLDGAEFAASCISPITIDGITSLHVNNTGAIGQSMTFSNGAKDEVRVSSRNNGNGSTTLRFDVIPSLQPAPMDSIKHVICIVDGVTPFRIVKLSDNTVALYLAGIDQEDVCASVHRDDAFRPVDACDCSDSSPSPYDPAGLPPTYQTEVVDIPQKADGCFYLVVPNFTGYRNPLSIVLEDGMISPKLTPPEARLDANGAAVDESQILDTLTSKGITLEVPGLQGGN